MGDPNKTTPETLTTDAQIPAPPDLSHMKKPVYVPNGARNQQIKADLANCKQHGMSVEVYYGKLTKIMDSDYRPLRVCNCGHCECDLGSLQEKDREDDRVHQFLYGLDEHKFQRVRSRLVSQIPLPSLEEAYNIIRQEEDLQKNSRDREETPLVLVQELVARDDVLDEGIIEILVHLPEKSLCRFKSVSKRWKSMIESSYLAKRLLARYPTPKLLVLRMEIPSDLSSRTVFLETVSKDHHDRIKIFTRTSTFDYKAYDLGRVMGYCNGLVCIYDIGYIYLINPATRKLRTISPKFLRDWTGRLGLLGELPVSVGFGRDIITGAYKVVLMYLYDPIINVVKAEVFNFDNGERRYIRFPISYNELSNDKTSIFANGSLYWLAYRKLMAFDLHAEKFRYVLLPSWYTKYSETVYLWSLRDRLCLSDVLQYPNVDVWGLQQEGPRVKWEKIRIINISNLDSLDANFWKLGIAACYLRSRAAESMKVSQSDWDEYKKHYYKFKPSNNFLEQVCEEHRRTVLYTENLVSSV